MADVVMPALGESVSEGTVNAWLKNPGDHVGVDDPLLEVSTDKVDTEIPSPFTGTVGNLLASEGDVVKVGAVICVIETAADTTTQPSRSLASGLPLQSTEPSAYPPPSGTTASAAHTEAGVSAGVETRYIGTFRSQPVTRTAEEEGVDLANVVGTGLDGRVRLEDVRAASSARQKGVARPTRSAPVAITTDTSAASSIPATSGPDPAPSRTLPTGTQSVADARVERLGRRRRIIAERMTASLQESAQLTSFIEVDLTLTARQIARVREEFMAREGVRLTFSAFVARATLDALREHPKLNARIDMPRGEVTYFPEEHLAIAVDTEAGLVTPVIRSAGDLSIAGLARRIHDVGARARAGKLSPDELKGGTFTLTNTGSRGVLADTPIINQPQVAILGAGAVVKRPVVMDDPRLGETIAVRHMAYMSLTYDHRLIDGGDAARYLASLRQRLETPPVDV